MENYVLLSIMYEIWMLISGFEIEEIYFIIVCYVTYCGTIMVSFEENVELYRILSK